MQVMITLLASFFLVVPEQKKFRQTLECLAECSLKHIPLKVFHGETAQIRDEPIANIQPDVHNEDKGSQREKKILEEN